MLSAADSSSSSSASSSSGTMSNSDNLAKCPAEFTPSSIHSNIPIESLLVDQDAAKELQCGICLQLLNQPRQCRNGHLFCHDCIMRSIEKSNDCPLCRCPLRAEELSRSLFVERHIRLLQVYCKYHFKINEDEIVSVDEEGCMQTCALEEVEKHEGKCGKALVPCRYSTACGKLRKDALEAHEQTCIYRPDECAHCKAGIPYNSMEAHKATCGMVPVACPKCNITVLRTELGKHSREACLEEFVPCDFHDQGCTFSLLRKHLKEHLEQDLVGHMMLMRKSYADQLTQLKQDYEKEAKLKDDKIRQLEKAARDSVTKIEWRIKNYSQVRKKSYIQSDKFTMEGFTWFIGVYMDGDNPESKGHISIYLFLDVGHIPKGKSIALDYSIKFVNHRDPADSIKKEFKSSFPIKAGQGWGDRKALPNSMIEQNGFIKDDTLLIEAEIIVKKVTWSV